MSNKSIHNKLLATLKDEETVVESRNIGIDKFAMADLVLPNQIISTGGKDNSYTNKKLAPGKRKTLYLSLSTHELIEATGKRLWDLRVENNDSKLVSIALNYLSRLDDENLIKEYHLYDAKLNKQHK